MELSRGLVHKQTQKLNLTQNLRTSLKLLEISNQELSSKIETELLENPVLEEKIEPETPALEWEASPAEKLGEPPSLFDPGGIKKQENISAQNIDWENKNLPLKEGLEKTERNHSFIQNVVRSEQSLNDHLLEQLNLSFLGALEQEIGEMIISAIDKNGFLVHDLRTLCPNQNLKQTREVLHCIQGFDPIGCGARGIVETLLIQLHHLKPEDQVARLIIENHFSDLEKLDLPKIKKGLGLNEAELRQSLGTIQSLEPYPAKLYAQQEASYLTPDIIVYNRDASLQVLLNDDWLPSLRIKSEYKTIFGDLKPRSKEHQYLKQKFNEAQELLYGITRRRQTLYQVAQCIVQYQKDFFLRGPGHLSPLAMRSVAKSLDMHESTISRAIANKSIQTQWGCYECKHFFTGGIKSYSAGGEEQASQNVKEKIRALIEKEKVEAPLSDQDLVSLLQKKSIQISRRTIAKYRKNMNIAPMGQRSKQKRLRINKM